MWYSVEFIGRKKNAIGITYPIQTYVEAENKEEANLKLYDNFDHIMFARYTKLKSKPGGVK